MNIREGLRRAVIIGTVLAEIGMAAYVIANPSHDRTSDMGAMLVFALAIPVVTFAAWLAGNWIIRGFKIQ